METLILVLFAALLLLCMLLGLPLLLALLAGLALFLFYGYRKGLSIRELVRLSLNGVRAAGGVISAMLVIGVLTALWRASGTIAYLISVSAGLIRPSLLLLFSFLLCSLVSFLTGTAFGTAATMGVICMTMARTSQLSLAWAGGAVLGGCFVGDRWSPISTSAMLVSSVTETSLSDNLRRMVKTAFLPFLLSCMVYAAVGLRRGASVELPDVGTMFAREFRLTPLCMLPAVAVLITSLLRVKVIVTMGISIAMAFFLCIGLQRQPLSQILLYMLSGYRAAQLDLAAMLDGGGLTSMLNVVGIILVSSCYAGLFEGTGLLEGIRARISGFSSRHGSFSAVTLTSVAACAVSCNQTLATMLTFQLCGDLYQSREQLALDLEDSVIVIAPLIPWSIAAAVPLATFGAPAVSIVLACYLWMLPMSRLMMERIAVRK